MPGRDDENLEDQTDEDELEDQDEEDESEDESESDESEGKPDPKVDKRISDLQSALDKETARANKLEKLQKRGQDGDEGGKDPERQALLAELREASLDAVLGENPELKQYGIDRNLIEGANRAELRESATQLVSLVKSVATKARNAALREHGLNAEPVGGTREKPKNYGTMSDEDFEKELARAKGGGDSLW